MSTNELAIVISIFALIVSAVSAWFSTLSQPKLTVDFNFLGVGNPGGGMCIVIPVTITNLGARGTTITDVGLIETCDDRHCFLGSWYTLKSESLEAFFKSRPKDDEPSPYIERTNSAYFVAGKSEITVTYIFHPRDEKSIPAIGDGALCFYRMIVRSPHGEWHSDNTVKFPDNADEAVINGRALLVNVQESILWQESKMREMQNLRYAVPKDIVPIRTLGVYGPHDSNAAAKSATGGDQES